MNPLSLVARVAGMAFITAAGINVLWKHFQPKPEDLVAAAIHFRKGVEEFQKGCSAVLFGENEHSLEQARKDRAAARISIE
jgi:hypothetical protein